MNTATNEEIIWNFLYGKLHNPYGTAGLMGNLFAESSLNPILANNVKKRTGLSNEEYTSVADTGLNDHFVTDGIAYGLAQWCYHTRKKALLDKAQKERKSVGDIHVQLEYLWTEIQSYKTVLRTLLNARTVKEASDVVLLKYEKPANKSDAVKNKRAEYGQKYFDKYSCANRIIAALSENSAEELMKELELRFDQL